jgi:hypothetical protein
MTSRSSNAGSGYAGSTISKATTTSTIMSKREFESIRESILPPKEDNYKEMRRQELKKLSQDRLQHWPNTLEALRLKKERFAIEREEEAERRMMRKRRMEKRFSVL